MNSGARGANPTLEQPIQGWCMGKIALLALALLFAPHVAYADMAMTNLTRLNTTALEKQGWTVRKQASRVTLFCKSCGEMTATDIILERANDGTEERIRSGQTTAKTMLAICKKNAENRGSACYGISPVALKGAVGFVSDVGVGPMGSAATYILWQDGRRLTIRNVAPTRAAARKHGKSMFRALASQIVR